MAKPEKELSFLDRLQLPDKGIKGLLKHLGPGIILMMTGVGTSHLITAPVAGGRFAFALLWAMPISYLIKYYGFEMCVRFTHATGYSVLDAMNTTWRKWVLWYVMIITIVQTALGQAGRVIAAAAVLYFGFTEFGGWSLDLWTYALGIGVIACGLVLLGSYKAVESTAKILILFLVASALFAFFQSPPPVSAYGNLLSLNTPEGSWFILGSFVGLLPTGIDVGLQTSEWTKARESGMPYVRRKMEEEGSVRRFDPFHPRVQDLKFNVSELPSHAQTYLRRWFRIGIADFALGHWLSLILAFIFMSLAAIWIYPSDVEGRAVMGEIAGVFTNSVGPYMMWIFLIGAMAATLSTAINYFDGWPRVIASCCRNLFRSTADFPGIDKPTPKARKVWHSEYNIWRATAIFSFVGSTLIIIGMPKPVFLVLTASVLSLIIAPVLYFFTFIFCRQVLPKGEKPFTLSPVRQTLIWISLAIFTIVTVIVIIQKL